MSGTTAEDGLGRVDAVTCTSEHQGASVPGRATATFIVESFDGTPYDDGQEADDGIAFSSALLKKVFHGDVEATSTVRMLAATTAVEGSAGYVGLERVVGSVDGRKGSFVLLHAATAVRGDQTGSWQVIPDSGSGELTGLCGTAELVRHPDGAHTMTLDYEIEG
jgi:hypothetical protein